MLNVVTTCLFTTHVIWKAVEMLSYGSIYAPMTFVSRVFMGLMMLQVAVSMGKAMIALFFGNAKSVADLSTTNNTPDFSAYIMEQGNVLKGRLASKSRFSAVYIRCKLARLMNDCLGVVRTEHKLPEGIQRSDYYLAISEKLVYDSDTDGVKGEILTHETLRKFPVISDLIVDRNIIYDYLTDAGMFMVLC